MSSPILIFNHSNLKLNLVLSFFRRNRHLIRQVALVQQQRTNERAQQMAAGKRKLVVPFAIQTEKAKCLVIKILYVSSAGYLS
jgi:hypothetical protein